MHVLFGFIDATDAKRQAIGYGLAMDKDQQINYSNCGVIVNQRRMVNVQNHCTRVEINCKSLVDSAKIASKLGGMGINLDYLTKNDMYFKYSTMNENKVVERINVIDDIVTRSQNYSNRFPALLDIKAKSF